jgi:hypothetical protein
MVLQVRFLRPRLWRALLETRNERPLEEIDALAYDYVLAHGYDGALAMLASIVDA